MIVRPIVRSITRHITRAITDAGVGGGPSLSVATAVMIGDSLTADSGQVATSATHTLAYGYFTWANALSEARFSVLKNAGVSGQTSTQIAARFAADVVAIAPKAVFILAGTNDAIGSSATTIANLRAMYDAARAAGIYVFALGVYWAPTYAAEKLADIAAVNAAIQSYAAGSPWIEYVDTSVLVDQPLYFRDSVHLNPRGAHAVGAVLAPRLARWGAAHALPSSPVDTTTYLSTNPLLAGAPTLKTNGTFSGQLPPSIELGFGATDTASSSTVYDDAGVATIRIAGNRAVTGVTTGVRLYAAPSSAPVTALSGYYTVRRIRVVSNTGALNGFLFGSSGGTGSRAFVANSATDAEARWPVSTDWMTVVSPLIPKATSHGGEFLAAYTRNAGEFEVDVQHWSLAAA